MGTFRFEDKAIAVETLNTWATQIVDENQNLTDDIGLINRTERFEAEDILVVNHQQENLHEIRTEVDRSHDFHTLLDALSKFDRRALVAVDCCHAGNLLSNTTTIRYSQKTKQFDVALTLDGKMYPVTTGELMRHLPVYIATRSSCLCGSPLSVTDYVLERDEDKISFCGIYICPVCSRKLNSTLRRVFRSTLSLIGSIEEVTLGPLKIKKPK